MGRSKDKIFTKEQKDIIRTYYPDFGYKKCQEFMPHLTRLQIASMASHLKVKFKRDHVGKISIENFTCLSNESIYTLGLIWGDGYINKRNNQIKFHIKSSDCDYLLSILNKVGQWNLYTYPDGNSVEIACVDYKLHQWFCQYDFQEKSYCEPTKILSIIPEEKHFLFWLGLIDADGSFYTIKSDSRFCFSLASTYGYQFSEFIKFCNTHNIQTKLRQRIKYEGKNSDLEIKTVQSLLNLGRQIYQTEIGLPRKRSRFEEFQSRRLSA